MDLFERMEKLKKQKEQPKKPAKVIYKKPVDKKPIIEGSDKITMDEARAQYIVICKKSPKHDSIHNKNWLINEIIKTLKQSKITK